MKLRLGRNLTLSEHIMKEIKLGLSLSLAPTVFAMSCFNAEDTHRLTGPLRFHRAPGDDPHYNMKIHLGTGFILDAVPLGNLKLLISLYGKKRGQKSDNPQQHVRLNTLKEIIPTLSPTLAPKLFFNVVCATLFFNAGFFRTRFRPLGPFDFEPWAPTFALTSGFSVFSHFLRTCELSIIWTVVFRFDASKAG